MKQLIKKSKMLLEEMLPYIQKFKGKIIVIKYGGKAMINNELKESVMKDIALLKSLGINPIIVHGGGPEITKEMEKAKLKPKFVNGLRVTDEKTVKIIKKVFSKINNEIRKLLEQFEVKAEKVEKCLIAKQKEKKLGLVGKITKVEKSKILKAIKNDKIPVISPLGTGNGKTYNINADTVATKIAIALKAEKLTIMTDVDGVIENEKLITHLSIKAVKQHIKKGVITKGMIPKVQACVEAVKAGCKKAHLINGTIEHSLLFEIFTEKGIGTEVVKNEIK
jgi:acetylglutamate kinase